MTRVVLVGGGGHASDILGAYEAISESSGEPHPVIGLVADVEIDLRRFAHRGVRQIGDLSDLRSIDASHYVLAIGYSLPRKMVAARVADCGLEPAIVIHPRAEVPAGVSIGKGVVILAAAHVSPLVTIGEHACLSYGSMVGHDCEVQDYVSVMPGAVVSGDTVLGEGCFIGANATIIEKVTIGRGAVIGAGAVVLKDVPPNVTATGVPATVRGSA
ncbi:acetyltransferase [Phenylobacterium sp. LjRoot219]|uniref:acetyltransferase n=1 Tax=Phenylobacterium sp. LjRoot219 TaxID=3342283 RepID=UPI003ED11764